MKNNEKKPSKNAFKPRPLVEARCGLKSSESDIFDMILSYINRDDDIADNLTYTLRVNDFKDKFGLEYAKNAYKKIRDGVGNLKGKTIDIWSDNGEKFESYVLFQTIKWNDREGQITVKIGEDLKKILLMQKQSVTYYEIRYTLPMNSRYSKRLYVMFKEWAQSPNKMRFDRVEDLREKLKVPASYCYNKFKERVIEDAINEINQSTDIFVTYKEEKSVVRGGQKVIGLTFYIKKKECVTDRIEQEGGKMILDHLRSNGILRVKPENAVMIYRTAQKGNLSDRQIRNRINIVLEKSNVKSIAGYLIFAMSDKFKTPKDVRNGFNRLEQLSYSEEWFRLFEKSVICPGQLSETEQMRFDELTREADIR